MTKSELKDIIKECLLEENTQEDIVEESIENITEDTELVLIENAKIKNIAIKINYGEEDDQFKNDLKILKSNWDKVEKSAWKCIEEQVKSWDQDFKEVKKYIIMDLIAYTRFKPELSTFEIYFNNGDPKGTRNKVLGGHTIIYEVNIKNGELKLSNDVELGG